MAETLSMVSTVSFVLAALFLLLAAFFWIKFGILEIIGDLSGRTARKSIAKMREKNEKTGIKYYKPSSVNLERGKTTGGILTEEIISEDKPETGLLVENQFDNLDENMTELLDDDNATGLLSEKEIDVTENLANSFAMLDEVVLVHTEEVIL